MNNFFCPPYVIYRFLIIASLLLFSFFLWHCGNASINPPTNTETADPLAEIDDPTNILEPSETPNTATDTSSLEAILNGQYIQSLHLHGGPWQINEPDQEITLHFDGTGLVQVKQVELVFIFEPLEAFNLDSAVFEPSEPAFITLGTGLEPAGKARLRSGFISFQNQNGDMALGTLRLKLNSTFIDSMGATVQLILLSLGPSSTERESYEAEVAHLKVYIQ